MDDDLAKLVVFLIFIICLILFVNIENKRVSDYSISGIIEQIELNLKERMTVRVNSKKFHIGLKKGNYEIGDSLFKETGNFILYHYKKNDSTSTFELNQIDTLFY